MTIQFPALKKPTLKQLQKKYDWIKSIEKDDSTEKLVTLELKKYTDNLISAAELETFAKDSKLGFQHMEYLVEHQDEFPELMAQAKTDDFWYILFPALVVVDRVGDRDVPCCSQDGARWVDNWAWLAYRFSSNGRVAFGTLAPKTLTTSPLETLTLKNLEKRIKALEDWRKS